MGAGNHGGVVEGAFWWLVIIIYIVAIAGTAVYVHVYCSYLSIISWIVLIAERYCCVCFL